MTIPYLLSDVRVESFGLGRVDGDTSEWIVQLPAFQVDRQVVVGQEVGAEDRLRYVRHVEIPFESFSWLEFVGTGQ